VASKNVSHLLNSISYHSSQCLSPGYNLLGRNYNDWKEVREVSERLLYLPPEGKMGKIAEKMVKGNHESEIGKMSNFS
jgi:hypothetical protein